MGGNGDLTAGVVVKLGIVEGNVDATLVDGRQDARGRVGEVGDGASYSVADRQGLAE
jgi:hypothetical protein